MPLGGARSPVHVSTFAKALTTAAPGPRNPAYQPCTTALEWTYTVHGSLYTTWPHSSGCRKCRVSELIALLFPSSLFLNVMVPASSPSMFSQKTNGETVNVLFCFVIKQETAEALQDLENAAPSVQLLDKYFREAQHDHTIANRFKMMGSVTNWERAELPSMLKSFNGKPTLVTKSGEWYYNMKRGYAELDCNTAHWCYMARKGLHSAWKNIGLAVFDFGVVVEARDDGEMPERILGCATMHHVRLDGQIQQWQGSCGPPVDDGETVQWKCYEDKKKKSRRNSSGA